MLENGIYGSTAELAGAEKISRSYVTRLLQLTLLAPIIVEGILEGRQSTGMGLAELTNAMPAEWQAQEAHFRNSGTS